jgi:hypothetical protein
MPEISLTDFVDFVASLGPPKLTKVRHLKSRGDYDPAADFWKRLREAIQTMHREGHPKSHLDKVLVGLTDKNKITAYPAAIKAYKKFLGTKTVTWFDPPHALWTEGELAVRINPELGLEINGKRYIVKLHFKRKPALSKPRMDVILHIMTQELGHAAKNLNSAVGVLDLPNAKLITPTVAVPNLGLVLKAEAAAFMTMWDGL